MPAWLISILVSLVLKYGLNPVLQRMPWLPQEVKDILQKIVDGFGVLKQNAKRQIKAHYEKPSV